MDKKTPVEVMFNVATYAITFANLEQVLKIVSLILSIITSIAILVAKIRSWWKKAKADGKITKDEIKEGIDIVTDAVKPFLDDKEDKKEE